MILFLYILLFLFSVFLLAFSSKWLVDILSRIGLFLKLKEFVVGFFLMAFAASLPNFFVGITSALKKIPELSFGDIIGNNLVDLTLVIGLAGLLSKGGLSAQSRTVQGSSLFAIFLGLLPLFLISDHYLSFFDGLFLILSFFIYLGWLFSKKERFTKIYDHAPDSINFRNFLKDLVFLFLGFGLLLLGAKGMVESAVFFSKILGLPIGLIGLFITAIGGAAPETFFSIQAAKKAQDWMILGDLLGGIIACATIILGIVAIICPIKIEDFSPFLIARIFLIISALFFFFFVRTEKKITKKESLFSLSLYFLFIVFEILTK